MCFLIDTNLVKKSQFNKCKFLAFNLFSIKMVLKHDFIAKNKVC